MANVKLVVMYLRPKDIDAFEKIYQNEQDLLASSYRVEVADF